MPISQDILKLHGEGVLFARYSGVVKPEEADEKAWEAIQFLDTVLSPVDIYVWMIKGVKIMQLRHVRMQPHSQDFFDHKT